MAVTTEQVQVEVEINGAKAGASIKDLESSAKQLRRELKLLPTDTEAFTKKAADLQKVNNQLQEINKSVKAVDKSLDAAGKQGGLFSNVMSGAFSVFLGGGLTGIVQGAISGIKDFFVASVDGAKNAARSIDQLTQALHGNREAAEDLGEQAEALEKQFRGLFDAEDIEDSQTRLALYTDEADQIKQLTPLIADLAAAKGIDLVSAADAVGKSISGSGDALKKMGISVKDAATEEERFKLISEGLTETVGGQAQVVANSTKTGWDSLKVTFGDLQKDLGAKLLPVINKLGEFLVELWNKSQPVVDIFKGIFSVFGQVWDMVKQLIASFGVFNDQSSLAERIIKGLTIVLKPMKIAWEGISYIIGKVSTALTELVAGANGTVNALVAIFSNFKTFFTNLFSNIGEVIKGVFTLDADQIKQGIAGMKTSFNSMGGAIAEAYNKGYTDVRDRQKAALVTQEETEHKNNIVKTEKKAKEISEAELKAKEDARKKAAAAQAKADADELKRKAELTNKLIALEQQLTEMKISVMEEGEGKAIAQENLRFEKEKQNIINQINELRALGANEATIAQKSYELNEAAATAHDDNIHDIHIKGWEKTLEGTDEFTERKRKKQEDDYNKQIEATNEFYDTLSLAIKQNSSEKIAAGNLTSEQIAAETENANEAILQLQLLKNKELLDVQKQYGKNTLATQSEISQQEVDQAQRTADQRKAIEETMQQTAQEGLDFAIDLLSQDEEARKKNAALLAAFNIAKIAIDLQREIQGIWASVSELGPIIGPNLVGIQTVFAIGRSALAVSKLKKAKYAQGGYTGDGVDIIDASGEPVAGVVHAKEWVAPKWMVSHPTYHNVINRLEGVRQRGFASGGFTTTPVNNISTSLDLMGTENKLDQLLDAFLAFPTRLKADVVYTEFETVQANVNDVRNAARVGK